jgi:MFS family permease
MAVFAYSADVTSLADKAKFFGYLEAAVYFGNFVGPYLGGILYDEVTHWFPYVTTAVCYRKFYDVNCFFRVSVCYVSVLRECVLSECVLNVLVE